MKSRIHPTLVSAAHSYTRSSEPWQMDPNTETRGRTSSGKAYGWRLFHYLSGGGMRVFGRTLEQDVRERRQNRFLVLAGVSVVVWLCLLVM